MLYLGLVQHCESTFLFTGDVNCRVVFEERQAADFAVVAVTTAAAGDGVAAASIGQVDFIVSGLWHRI